MQKRVTRPTKAIPAVHGHPFHHGEGKELGRDRVTTMKLHVENESIGATYIAMAFAALSLMSLSVHADQLFVSDKLVISVYTEANQDSDKLTTIDSGDAVEALEKAEGYTHIRLADGREGWVKSSYLNAQTPAIV